MPTGAIEHGLREVTTPAAVDDHAQRQAQMPRHGDIQQRIAILRHGQHLATGQFGPQYEGR